MTFRTSRGIYLKVRNLNTRLGWFIGGVTVLTACVAIRSVWGPDEASAQLFGKRATSAAAKPAAKPATSNEPSGSPDQKPQLLAVVNGDKIGRNELAQEAMDHYGEDVVESLINKHVIAQACKAKGITVSSEEVGREIDRMAQRFQLSTERWLKMLKDERQVSPQQYAKDIVWPTIALRKLASARLEVSDDEIQKAYETQFGPQVQTRLIACSKLEKARQVHAAAVQKPEDFGNLAKQYSEDPGSASAKGLVQPIRKHLGDPKLEQVAFAMSPGEISEVVAINDQFLIIKCESHIPAAKMPMDQVYETLKEACRDRKLRLVAADIFEELKKDSKIENIYIDPTKRAQFPGIAAIVNDQRITMLEVAEECLERKGKEVLEGMINRKLVEQACVKQKITVTEQEINEEIARAAVAVGKTKPNGEADVEAWLKEVIEEQKTPLELYKRDAVWPTVALKKLVGDKVDVSSTDLQKGYEANYGPRVRCRAIVFTQHRKALEVWDMARKRPTVEYFGDLAEEYSVEASSRALRGEVPPIQKHSAQPVLEKEAFSLNAGELSSVIQMGDKFVILFCEGRTTPTPVKFEEVRSLLHEDVHEKKLRVAMAREFTALQDSSQIDNFLAGTIHMPGGETRLQEMGALPGDNRNTAPKAAPLPPGLRSQP
jgi:parvulin-like peptidyl-prolyl isomerase